MRATYLIARREYLSYVATWGFWLSLLAVPIFAFIGGATPALIESSQPTRYFAVIDETGQGLDALIRDRQLAERRADIRNRLETLARSTGGAAAAEAALAAFDADPDGLNGLDEAVRAGGLEAAAPVLQAGRARSVQVEPPAPSVDGLRPWLTGERMMDTPEGERALFAAFIIRADGGEGLEAVYLSANLTSDRLRSEISAILRDHMREQALASHGLEPGLMRDILTLRPAVTTLDARPGAETGAEVTAADRAPFFIAIAMAFILWMAVFSVANMLLTGLIEEKGGKIIELLLSTARFHEILAGKLAGVAAVSLTLFAVWGLAGGLIAGFGGAVLSSVDPRIAEIMAAIFDPGLLLAALFFFIAGYLMYGAIFLAMGSLCDTLQDAQTLMAPVIWILMLPLLFLFFSFEASDSLVVRAASWIPLWTPFLMLARLPSDPPFWELAGSSMLMIVTTVAVLWGAAAVFRKGALRQADADTVRRWFRLGRKKG